MSERKVLNKYYPPDFDPSKIPKLKQQKNKQYTIRTMAPFNMRCNTCADYIYKGRKFNAKCEVAEGENFLGLRIFRFYIRCPKCITEIMFKTDPENTDYTLESGATRLFEAAKLIEEAEKREQKQREEDATNPMKMLETRTKDSKLEMDIIENLEDLREINTRKEEVDYTEVLRKKAEEEQERLLRQEREDEEEIKRIFGQTSEGSLKRLQDDSDEDGEAEFSPSLRKHLKASDVLVEGNSMKTKSSQSNRKKISSMIKRKQVVHTQPSESSDEASPIGMHAPETTLSESARQTVDHERGKTSQTTSQPLSSDSSKMEPMTETGGISDAPKGEPKTMQGSSKDTQEQSNVLPEPSSLFDSIKEGMTKKVEQAKKKETEKQSSFGLLVGYEGSDTDSSSEDE